MKLILENWRQYLNEIGGGENPYQFGDPKPLTRGQELFAAHGAEWRGDPSIIYEFYTPENHYSVLFEWTRENRNDWWVISFELEVMGRGQDRMSLTGEGKPLRVVSTVVAIIKDFIQKYTEKYVDNYIKRYPRSEDGRTATTREEAMANAPGTLNFRFVGIAKNEEQPTKGVEATGRTRLYKAFLKRHMPPGTEIIDFTKNEIGFKVPIRTPEE